MASEKCSGREKSKFIKIIIKLFHRFIEHDIFALAGQLAYNMLLSLFPLIIFIMTLVGYSSVSREEVILNMQNIFPAEIFKFMRGVIIEIVGTQQGGLLSLSFVFMIAAASGGFSAVIKGLNKAYLEKEKRGFIKLTLLALIFTLTFALITIIAAFLLVFGEFNGKVLVRMLGLGTSFEMWWNILRYIAAVILMFLGFMILYKFAPSRKLSFRNVLPGALFSTIAWNIISIAFSYYVNNFANFSLVYGSIGAVIMLLSWLLIISVFILAGGELNAVLLLGCDDSSM